MEASFCGADKGSQAGKHFNTDHYMLAGRKLLEALIVLGKINVHKTIKEIKPKIDMQDYEKMNAIDIQKEL